MTIIATYQKASTAVLDYVIDWSDWLASDTIATSTWAADTGITVGSSSNTTTTATVFVSGGTAGNTYRLTNTITTAGSRTDVRSLIIQVGARAGMQNLIRRVRGLAQAGTADYSIPGDGTYFTDGHIQDALDRTSTDFFDAPLAMQQELGAGGSAVYYSYFAPTTFFEEASSGTAYWLVKDSLGSAIGTASYTVDYQQGIVRFTTNTDGTVYYLRGRAYNPDAAAADIWRQKAGAAASGYEFSTDNQTFKRDQLFKHYTAMAEKFERSGGVSTGIYSTRMTRRDLTRWQQ